jgi:hypothetical protein
MRWTGGASPGSKLSTKCTRSGRSRRELGCASCGLTGAGILSELAFILQAIERYRAGFDLGKYWTFLARVESPARKTRSVRTTTRTRALLEGLICITLCVTVATR